MPHVSCSRWVSGTGKTHLVRVEVHSAIPLFEGKQAPTRLPGSPKTILTEPGTETDEKGNGGAPSLARRRCEGRRGPGPRRPPALRALRRELPEGWRGRSGRP